MIDVHSHVLNFAVCPNKWLTKITHIPYVESILKKEVSEWIFSTLIYIKNIFDKTKKFKRLAEMIDIFKQPLFDVGKILHKEMVDAGVKLSTPLMMDLEFATSKHYGAELDYGIQVEIMKRIASNYFGEIMPFFGFDPRRPGAFELAKFCLEEKGMLGVKVYTKLGFHPSPQSVYNSQQVNCELSKLYNYCESNHIPITTHCSQGGAYSQELVDKSEEWNTLAHPSAWEEVLLLFPNLRLNFAHFGGDLEQYTKGGSKTWCSYIIEYMKTYKYVYADVSYNDIVHDKKCYKKYFNIINKLLLKEGIIDRVLLGSDWSMIRHTWTIKEFFQPFKDTLSSKVKSQIFYLNAIKFLFAELAIPQRILNGLHKTQSDTPVWLASKFTEIREDL